MDLTALAFCFPVDPRCAKVPPDVVVSNFQKLCQETARNAKCHVVLGPFDGKKVYTVCLSGTLQSVISARGMLLNSNPWLITEVVKASRYEILKPNMEMKPIVRGRINEIQSMTTAQITLRNSGAENALPGGKGSVGLTSKVVDVSFTGLHNQIDGARIQFLVLMDEMVGLYVERVELDLRLHNIMAGRKHANATLIMEETVTNMYFPSSITLNTRKNGADDTCNYLYITGEYAGVQRAKEMVLGFAMHKRKQMISREVAILPRKLDWMLTARPDDLLAIMSDNATYVEFPSPLAQTGILTVYGENRVDLERTIRSLMQLSCYHFAAWLWVNPPHLGGAIPTYQFCTPPPQRQLLAIISQVSHMTGAEILFRNYAFEVYGLDNQVRLAYQRISDLDFVRCCHRESKFQVELAAEHRDFVSGKKNGKINKIMKVTNVRIKYETFNEYNFLIDVWSNTCAFALEGLGMLQEELPAEISFHVPESYHKRIIGVGGKNIQRIMKKYGVYVKFSNAEEFAALGGYFESHDNVVARTPAKNAINLEYLKQAVMELVAPKDKDFITDIVAIPRQHHRAVIGYQGSVIHNIESQTGTEIKFPNRETGSDYVRVTGPVQQTRHACQLLYDVIPEDYEVRIPASTTLLAAISSVDFRDKVVARLQREFNATLLYTLPSSPNKVDGGDYLFLLRYNRGNADLLPAAKEVLMAFLAAHQVPAYPPSHSLSVNESVTDGAFQHFNSKLLSTVPSPSYQPISSGYSSYSLFEKGTGNAFANSRGIGSSSNLEGLFEKLAVGGSSSAFLGTSPSSMSASAADGTMRNFGVEANQRATAASVSHKPIAAIDRWNIGVALPVSQGHTRP